MKRLFLYIGIAIIAVSCSKSIDATTQPDIVEKITPATIYASIYNSTRSELHWENATTPRTYWSENDKIAVLNGTTEYDVYELAGQSGSLGAFSLSDESVDFVDEEFELDNMIAFYPYTDSNSLTPWKSQDGERKYLTYIAPNTQTFVGSNTYGANVNPMIAVAEKNSTENIQFKNIFGYLRVTLKGDEVIKKVILKGNNNEIIAGDIVINLNNIKEIVTDGSDQIITIDCGDGVELTEEGISFIFTLPPTEFTNGFTIYAMDSDDGILTLNSKPVTITQNVITPMPAVLTQGKFEATNPITYEAASRIEIDSRSVQNNIISHSYSSGVGKIIILEDKLKSGIFNGSSITSITIPVGITSIDKYAFNSCPNLQSVTLNGGFGQCAGREGPVKAHILKAALNIFKLLLADDDVATHQQGDVLEACFVALFPHTAAVQLTLTVQGRYHDGICAGFDGSGDVFFLSHHNAQVDYFKTGFCKGVIQDLVAHCVDVCANNAHNQNFLFSSLHFITSLLVSQHSAKDCFIKS